MTDELVLRMQAICINLELNAADIENWLDDFDKEKRMAKAKLGSGKRFSELKGKLADKGAKNPSALAAWIGDKKYGKKKMGQMAARARKK